MFPRDHDGLERHRSFDAWSRLSSAVLGVRAIAEAVRIEKDRRQPSRIIKEAACVGRGRQQVSATITRPFRVIRSSIGCASKNSAKSTAIF